MRPRSDKFHDTTAERMQPPPTSTAIPAAPASLVMLIRVLGRLRAGAISCILESLRLMQLLPRARGEQCPPNFVQESKQSFCSSI